MPRKVSRAQNLVGGIDPWLSLAFLALLCIGIVMVYSSSIADAYTYYGSTYYVLIRQGLGMGIGLVAVIAMTRINYHRLQIAALPLFVASVALLVIVLAPHFGHTANGARRWFALGAGISLEPSEVVKLALVIYLAHWFASKREMVKDFRSCFIPFAAILGMVALLIVKQPDLGTAIVVCATGIAIFFVAGANLLHLATLSLGAGSFAWFLARSSAYRYDRLTAFLHPWKDPTGTGYHAVQALLALGSGGLFGEGLGNSPGKYVLPAAHTDSILAVIGEEWGLLGTVAVLLLFVVIAYRGMRITISAPDTFGKLLAAGITSWITFQALLNFAVITSSVPFTGVPLPFVSYGGTSLVISMCAVGILLNVSRHASRTVVDQGSDNGGRKRGPRLSRPLGHPVPATAATRVTAQLRAEPREVIAGRGAVRPGSATIPRTISRYPGAY